MDDDWLGITLPLVDMSVSHRDPMLEAQERARVDTEARQTASKQRLAEMDRRLAEEKSEEVLWQQTVKRRKEEERRQQERAKEEALAAVEASKTRETAQVCTQPRSTEVDTVARDDLIDLDAQRAAAALEEEWRALHTRHRQEMRANREVLREQCRLESEAQAREREAMACEDAVAAVFTTAVNSACAQRQLVGPRLDTETRRCVESFERRAHLELLQREQEAIRRTAREDWERLLEEERREREYREWRKQVAQERRRTARFPEERSSGSDLRSGCSPEASRTQDALDQLASRNGQAAISHCVALAMRETERFKSGTCTPRETLEKARRQAELQRAEREAAAPAAAEKELWESMLAKNRLSKQRERVERTPRWGICS